MENDKTPETREAGQTAGVGTGDLVRHLIQSLRDIADPISKMRRELPEGAQLNGMMAVTLSGDANYLKESARKALREIGEDA